MTSWRDTGLLVSEEQDDAAFAAARHSLFDGPFTWPVLVLRRSALEHNIETVAAYLRARGFRHAPHAKTTLAPLIMEEQLLAGAWGFTAATAHQALLYRRFGIRRIILANQVLDPRALNALAAELDQDPEFELLVYADSAAGVAALSGAAGARPFQVLAELGYPGGRTGCRTQDELAELVALIDRAPGVEAAGVAAFEGGLPDRDAARALVRDLLAVAGRTGARIVSAGGSSYLDVVADELEGADHEVIIRSGAYVTHDDGFYDERARLPLHGALELWAQVVSAPEPGLALAGMGKREAPYDLGLPVALEIHRDGAVLPADGVTVRKLDDHHAYLDGGDLHPGDVLRFGVSHPCTAFDKWRVIPLVDDEHRVVDLVRTYF